MNVSRAFGISEFSHSTAANISMLLISQSSVFLNFGLVIMIHSYFYTNLQLRAESLGCMFYLSTNNPVSLRVLCGTLFLRKGKHQEQLVPIPPHISQQPDSRSGDKIPIFRARNQSRTLRARPQRLWSSNPKILPSSFIPHHQ